MTQAEITKKSNSYKTELNNCTTKIDKCEDSIRVCNRIKKYYRLKTPEKQKLSNVCLVVGILSLPISIACTLFSPILGAFLLAGSIVSIERYFFFRNVIKKFNYCQKFFGRIVKSLTDKQSNFEIQKEHALEEICKLEKEIPDPIIETDSIIDDDFSKINSSSFFEKCIEKTSKSNEETVILN